MTPPMDGPLPHTDRSYRADIDGLRAIAVAVVVLFHAGVPGFAGGFVGVDVFFVISGFLVTGLLVRELDAGTFSFRTFIERRIRRLLPAVAAMLLTVSALALPLLAPSSLTTFARTVAATTLSGANIYLWQTADYFAEAAEFNLLLHMWSLGVEEQFYLVTPIILLITTRFARRHLWLVVLALGVASLAFSVWSVRTIPTSAFFLLPSRFWELAVGALIAVVPLGGLPRSRPFNTALAVTGLTAMGAAVVGFDAEVAFPGTAALVPVLGAAAVIVAGRTHHDVAPLLSSRPLLWVGLRSYAIYLWHWPLLALARHALQRPLDVTESLGVVTVAVVVAAVMYAVVETPARKARALRPLPFAALTVAVGVCFAVVVDEGAGFPQRFGHTAPAAFSRIGEVDATHTCSMDSNLIDPPWGGDACALTTTGPARVLLWGDSLAGHYRYGFKQAAASIPATVLEYSTTLCGPIVDDVLAWRPGCKAFNDRGFKLATDPPVDVVVLAARWQYVLMRQGSLERLTTSIERLQKAGVTVVVVGQTPVFTADPRTHFLRADPTLPSTRAWTTTHTRINEKVRAALPAGAIFVDPSPALCDDDGCLYRDGGQFLFHDPAHLSGSGSELVVKAVIAPALRRAIEERR